MLDALPGSARLWLFALDGEASARLVSTVNAFCETWTSHGRAVTAAAEALASGRVLAVAALISEVDVNAGVSGCGIDAMQHAVETAVAAFGLTLTPPLAVSYFDAGHGWRSVGRAAFRRLVSAGEAGSGTRVLDLTPGTLGALRAAGGTERPAGASWHAAAFGLVPAV